MNKKKKEEVLITISAKTNELKCHVCGGSVPFQHMMPMPASDFIEFNNAFMTVHFMSCGGWSLEEIKTDILAEV